MVLVGVGSKNPVKIEATKEAFSKVFDVVELVSSEVKFVEKQPFSIESMIANAFKRANYMLKKFKNLDFAVGIEGGIYITAFGAFVGGYVVISDGNRYGIGSSISILLPDKIVEMFEKGEISELEEGMEKLTGIKNPGEKMGAIGILTNGLLNRKKAFIDAILSALAPFITNYYK